MANSEFRKEEYSIIRHAGLGSSALPQITNNNN
jgi:hypothetical protein